MTDNRPGQLRRDDGGRDEQPSGAGETTLGALDPAMLAEVVAVVEQSVRQQRRRFPSYTNIELDAVVQEVLTNLLRAVMAHPDLLADVHKLRAYTATIVRSRLIDAVRRSARRAQHEGLALPGSDDSGMVADNRAAAAFNWAEWRAELERVRQHLLPSNPALATTIALLEAYEFDLPLATLADHLDVSVATASRLRAQALAYLRRILVDR